MTSLLQIKKHVPSGTIILNRPDRRNALSRELVAELQQALRDFHLEKSVRAVILTGAGDAFCAGIDLSEIRSSGTGDDAYAQWYRDAVQYKELIEFMLRFPKPIIAAVNGPAVAAGAGLVLASDLAVAAPEASIGVPEPRRGLVAGLVAPLLHFRAGAGAAARLLLTAETMGADEAVRIGLFHELVEHDLLWARAHQLAGEIAKSAPESIQLTKRMLNETMGEQLGTWLASGAAASATARTTEAATEGVAAFLEKREPNWK
jgi:methylglutaconyl-CoA hydratase